MESKPFPPESWPPNLSPAQLSHLTLLATTYALSNSLLYLPPHTQEIPPPPAPTSAIHAPLSLFPTPIPRKLFAHAQALQRAYNLLYARVAMDVEFLDQVMGAGGVADVDDFTGELWRAWKSVRDESVQPLHLGLFRSDYLLHQPDPTDEVSLKQVEFNTISASFGALSQQVSGMHRYLQASTGYFGVSPSLKPENFPPNETVKGLVAGLAEAHKAYGVPSAYVLFVVQPDERNIFDQRLLEYELLSRHGVRVARQTFLQLQTSVSLSPTRTLHITSPLALPSSSPSPSALEIAVVYLRAGYTPTDYPTPTAYRTRTLLERSRAIQCPSLALQLAGGKKVQEVLARPGVLERFLAADEGADAVRGSWVGMWGLDARAEALPPGVGAETETAEAGVRLARARAQELVLKPQREGGGNNVYRDAIPGFLDALPAPERAAWIAMELIRPPVEVGGCLVKAGEEGVVKGRVVSELGVFGWALFGGEEATGGEGGRGRENVRGGEAGWLVRTKAEGVDEGGVAAGVSALDSVLLVDDD
ncbi:glutathione synthase [Amylostereum chailletii]|nr:glutathione synthase [Amylostereum chailletii]